MQVNSDTHASRQLPHGAEHRRRPVLVATNKFISKASPLHLVCTAFGVGADSVELLKLPDGDQQLVLGDAMLAASR